MSNLKKKLDKTADSINEIESCVKKFTDSLNDIVIKELNNAGIETDDYERNNFNVGAIAVGLATLGEYNDSAGYVNSSLAEKIQEVIDNMVLEGKKGGNNNE